MMSNWGLLRVAVRVVLVCSALSVSGCATPLSETLLGSWKGHFTTKSRAEMRAEAVTFTFKKTGLVVIVFDNGRRAVNTYKVLEERSVIFFDDGKTEPSAEWFPSLNGRVFEGPVKRKMFEKNPDRKATLKLKRVAD